MESEEYNSPPANIDPNSGCAFDHAPAYCQKSRKEYIAMRRAIAWDFGDPMGPIDVQCLKDEVIVSFAKKCAELRIQDANKRYEEAMQTFLPYPQYDLSAVALDRLRLGKQRVETYQILRTLTGQSDGWRNHPAVKMWVGYVPALAAYGVAMCDEWIKRGYKDTLKPKIMAFGPGGPDPWWLNGPIHSSHRARLLMKDPEWYGRHEWFEQPSDEYFWPIK